MPEAKRLYHFTPTKYALKGIQDRRLKAAELHKTNDPYDLLPVQWGNDEDKENDMNMKYIFGIETKVLCFSETYEDPSLWGHYADKGKGMCLGFDVCESSILQMEYLRSRKESVQSPEESLYLLKYKSYHWQHEREWRMNRSQGRLELDPITGLYYFPFGCDLRLREILIGFRCEEEIENIDHRLQRLITEYDPRPDVVSTRLSFSAFAIKKMSDVSVGPRSSEVR